MKNMHKKNPKNNKKRTMKEPTKYLLQSHRYLFEYLPQ